MTNRKLFHLHFKKSGKDAYYGSIKALADHNEQLKFTGIDVSRHTLYRYDWDVPYENEFIVIKKGILHTTGSVGKKKKA